MSAVIESLDMQETEAQVAQDAATEAASAAQAAEKAAADKAAAEAAEKATAEKAAAEKVATERKQERTVPVSALTAERRKWQEQIAASNAKLESITKELEALKNPPPKMPAFEEDPKGYIDGINRANAAKIERLEEEKRLIAEQTEMARIQQHAINMLRQNEAEFAGKNADYFEALEYSRNIRREQIRIFAPDADDQQVDAELTRQELATAFGMLNAGQNPAERAYAYAKTLGYTPKQAAAMAAADAGKTTQATQARADDGKFAKKEELTPEQKAELEQRKQAALSLGAGGDGLAEAEAEMSNTGDVFDMAKAERFGT